MEPINMKWYYSHYYVGPSLVTWALSDCFLHLVVDEVKETQGDWTSGRMSGARLERAPGKTWKQPLANSQSEDKGLISTATQNWIWPTIYMILEADSSPESLDNLPFQLAPWFPHCVTQSRESVEQAQTSDLHNCEVIHGSSFERMH